MSVCVYVCVSVFNSLEYIIFRSKQTCLCMFIVSLGLEGFFPSLALFLLHVICPTVLVLNFFLALVHDLVKAACILLNINSSNTLI